MPQDRSRHLKNDHIKGLIALHFIDFQVKVPFCFSDHTNVSFNNLKIVKSKSGELKKLKKKVSIRKKLYLEKKL